MPNNQLDPNKWITLYADYLFNYTIVRVKDRETAQDLVQETFFAGLKSMANFKGEASERHRCSSRPWKKGRTHYSFRWRYPRANSHHP